jgi:hypothetical protein
MGSRNHAPRAMSLPLLQVRPRNSQLLPALAPRSQRTQERSSRIETRFALCAFNNLRTLSLAPKLQPSPFHTFPHSFAHSKNITPAFPTTSALFSFFCTRGKINSCIISRLRTLLSKWGVPRIPSRSLLDVLLEVLICQCLSIGD